MHVLWNAEEARALSTDEEAGWLRLCACTLHVGVQRPHEVGHAFIMKPLLLSHWPSFAHELQDTSVSSHVRVQVAHE